MFGNDGGITLIPVDTRGEPAYREQARRDFQDAWLRQRSGGLAEMLAARLEGKAEPTRSDACFCPADADRSCRYIGDETYRCDACGVHIVRGVADLSTAERDGQLSLFAEVQDATS